MFKSIRSRLIASYLLVILLAMGIAALLAWSALDRAFLDVLRENLVAQARRVAQTVEAGDMSGFGTQPDPYSQASNVLPGYHTRVIDDEGVVILGLSATDVPITGAEFQPNLSIYEELSSNLGISRLDTRSGSDIRSREAPTDDLLSRSEIQSALRGEPATAVRSYSWTAQRRVLYAAYPIRLPDGSVVSVVYVASPLPRLTLSLLPDYFGAQTLGGAAVAVVLAGLVGLLLARQLIHPLRDLTNAVSALSRGESVSPLPPASTSELHTLGTAFNTMNTNLTAAYDSLAAQANQREAILNNLADAVLAADSAGEVILANPAASALLEIAPQTLHQAIQHTLGVGESHATEITVRNQVVELLITPLRDENGHVNGAVAVGHDVTAYRQLDRLRTNFVSDVSHELRTPLTAIKGFIETLQDGAVDDLTARDRFLDTIAVETERLIRLTNDLLLLTRADAGQLVLHLASTDLVAAVERAVAQLEGRAREKQITLNIEMPEFLTFAQADADRIHQVLVNLLDNAIKFTLPRGQVSVSFGQTGEQTSCTVTDTGPGIPTGEIPHLFERFYRGDPSRARAEDQSGVGLGLSIARAIVEAHGGQIWIESEPDQGAFVTFTMPLTV
ncbi:MAG: cell wall metabolism sensor histidine kinase WalK [Chloroflexi bacterium]|nr:cell wall metabolism sensor histidine kinase WalK [Chloroflexota bacterium]